MTKLLIYILIPNYGNVSNNNLVSAHVGDDSQLLPLLAILNCSPFYGSMVKINNVQF